MTLISAEDIKYFIDPNPTTFVPREFEDHKVYVVDHRRKENLGQVTKVTRTTTDHSRIYYVTEHGDRVSGHPYNWFPSKIRSGTYMVTFLGPETFAIVYVTSVDTNRRGFKGQFQMWSDGVPHITSQGRFKNGVPMAHWAIELWPTTQDHPELVAAKLASAKLRWEQANKKLALLDQAQIRGWMEHLTEIRAGGHRFPSPVYSLYMSGRVLMKAGRKPTDKAIEKINEENKAMGSKLQMNRNFVESYVAYPFNNLFANLNMSAEALSEIRQETLNDEIRNHFNDHTLDASITTRARYMSGAVN